jgi:hypothetical protein
VSEPATGQRPCLQRAGLPAMASPGAQGRWVVLGLVLLGLVAAGVAWVWNFQRGRRALEFFGPSAAWLIRRAPLVELVVLAEPLLDSEPAPPGTPTVRLGGVRWAVQQRKDLSRAPGILNARTSLLQDASFQNVAPQPYDGPMPPVLLRFADGAQQTWVAFRLSDGWVVLPEQARSLPLVPSTARGWRDYLQRQLRPSGAPRPQDERQPR